MTDKNENEQVEAKLNTQGEILQKTFEEFAKSGITVEEEKAIGDIDSMLTEATIQLTKSGGAVIADNNGTVVKIDKPRQTGLTEANRIINSALGIE